MWTPEVTTYMEDVWLNLGRWRNQQEGKHWWHVLADHSTFFLLFHFRNHLPLIFLNVVVHREAFLFDTIHSKTALEGKWHLLMKALDTGDFPGCERYILNASFSWG